MTPEPDSQDSEGDFSDVEKTLEDDGYQQELSPEEDVEIHTMREEVPDTVPISQSQIDDEEPDPNNYDVWGAYIHDLLEHEIGYQPDQAAVVDPDNPADPANNGIVLDGDLIDVTSGDHGVELVYAISDHFLEDADYPVDSEEEMPDIWGSTQSTVTLEYDADSFMELKEKTRRAAEYIRSVDEALSTQPQP